MSTPDGRTDDPTSGEGEHEGTSDVPIVCVLARHVHDGEARGWVGVVLGPAQ
jgi:hypothetical protein